MDLKNFVSNTELESVKLLKLSCTQNQPASVPNEVKVGLAFKSEDPIWQGNRFLCPFAFKVNAYSANDETDHTEDKQAFPSDDDRSLFEIVFRLQFSYFIESDALSAESIEMYDILKRFSENVLPVQAWPYINELLANLTVRMGFPPLHLKPFEHYSNDRGSYGD